MDKTNAHIKKMNGLVKEEANLWKTVYFNLDKKTSSAYNIAAHTLENLYNIAVFFDKKSTFLKNYTMSKTATDGRKY